jgi:phosphoenolpyruvate carboxykinase (GTP)
VRALLWLWQFAKGEVKGNPTAVGVIPTADELNLEGMEFRDGDLDTLLSIDVDRWKQEMGFREEHLKQFNLPEAIWEAHRRVAGDLGA